MLLSETGKARLTADEISRRDYLPSPFLLAQFDQLPAEEEAALERDAPDWYKAVSLQAALIGVDALGYVPRSDTTVLGELPPSYEVDVAALRTAVRPDIRTNDRLLVGADPVTFDGPAGAADDDLIELLAGRQR